MPTSAQFAGWQLAAVDWQPASATSAITIQRASNSDLRCRQASPSSSQKLMTVACLRPLLPQRYFGVPVAAAPLGKGGETV